MELPGARQSALATARVRAHEGARQVRGGREHGSSRVRGKVLSQLLAYAGTNLSSSSKGGATRCLVWLGGLIDAEKLGGNAAGSDTLHLCIAGVATTGPLYL